MKPKSASGSNLRRSGRRNVTVYEKGDYVELFVNGGTVTGRLIEKRSSRTPSGHPIWIVCPSDRRRRNEEVPESALCRVIDVDEAMNNKSLAKATRNLQNGNNGNSNSDGSYEGELNEEGEEEEEEEADDFSEENSKSDVSKKRKGDDSIFGDRISDARNAKHRKTVTFQENGKYSPTPSSAVSSKYSSKHSSRQKKGKSSSRIGTRSSTRGTAGETPASSSDGNNNNNNSSSYSSNNFENLDLLPAHPTKKKKKKKKSKGVFKGYLGKGGKLNKDENVVVVKMLTGTLYLFRGERPRAEFVRSK